MIFFISQCTRCMIFFFILVITCSIYQFIFQILSKKCDFFFFFLNLEMYACNSIYEISLHFHFWLYNIANFLTSKKWKNALNNSRARTRETLKSFMKNKVPFPLLMNILCAAWLIIMMSLDCIILIKYLIGWSYV